MIRRPPRATRTDTLFPYTTLFRSSMQEDPRYDDVVADVHRFLAERIFAAEMAGIEKKRLVVDPGFGFGKNRDHNLALLAQLPRFTELGVPLLAGLSRKKTIGGITGRDVPADRLHGSVAAHLIAAQRGAMLPRVPDVVAPVRPEERRVGGGWVRSGRTRGGR